MKNPLEKILLISVGLILILMVSGCAHSGRSQLDYFKPEHVKCADSYIKICRQFGTHLLCECRRK
jgi:hypothetical protein